MRASVSDMPWFQPGRIVDFVSPVTGRHSRGEVREVTTTGLRVLTSEGEAAGGVVFIPFDLLLFHAAKSQAWMKPKPQTQSFRETGTSHLKDRQPDATNRLAEKGVGTVTYDGLGGTTVVSQKIVAAVYEDGSEAKIGDFVRFKTTSLVGPYEHSGVVKEVRDSDGMLLIRLDGGDREMGVPSKHVVSHHSPSIQADHVGVGDRVILKDGRRGVLETEDEAAAKYGVRLDEGGVVDAKHTDIFDEQGKGTAGTSLEPGKVEAAVDAPKTLYPRAWDIYTYAISGDYRGSRTAIARADKALGGRWGNPSKLLEDAYGMYEKANSGGGLEAGDTAAWQKLESDLAALEAHYPAYAQALANPLPKTPATAEALISGPMHPEVKDIKAGQK